MKPTPKNDTKKRSPGSPARRLAFAAGLFALLCGLAIVLFGGGAPIGDTHDGPTRAERARERALEHAEAAERALMDRDYGEARAHVRQVRATLARQEAGRRAAAE